MYWLAYLFLIAVQSVVLAQLISGGAASFYDIATSVGPVVLLVTLYSNLAIAVKRLHDIGYGGFLALALFIPLVNLAFTIWVGVLPGTPDPNRFGDAADVPPP
jgi:uncharacterized membrane protein YhaH (DUF805 family)